MGADFEQAYRTDQAKRLKLTLAEAHRIGAKNVLRAFKTATVGPNTLEALLENWKTGHVPRR